MTNKKYNNNKVQIDDEQESSKFLSQKAEKDSKSWDLGENVSKSGRIALKNGKNWEYFKRIENINFPHIIKLQKE